MLRRLLALPLVALVALVAFAAPAGAHVDVEGDDLRAGATTTITFSFHHGKDGTATTGLEVLMPQGASIVEVPPLEGWAAAVDEGTGTVTWTGGPVPDGTEARFPVVVTLPATPGEVLFKTIQVTEAGELAWIQEEADPEEGSYPAPRLTLLPNPDATTTLPAPTTESTAATATTERQAGTTLEAEQRDEGGNNAAAWLIGSGLAAIVVVGLGGYALTRRAQS